MFISRNDHDSMSIYDKGPSPYMSNFQMEGPQSTLHGAYRREHPLPTTTLTSRPETIHENPTIHHQSNHVTTPAAPPLGRLRTRVGGVNARSDKWGRWVRGLLISRFHASPFSDKSESYDMKFNFSEVLVAAGIQQGYLSMCLSNGYVPCFVVS